MCTRKCSRVVGVGLWPLALTCTICNLLLCFPDWDTQYVQGGGRLLTPEVLYLGGLVGGGAMILIPAIHIQATSRQACCGNRCGMFLSILFALVGVAGSVYAVSVSALGLVNGPLCQVREDNGSLSTWAQPFRSAHEELSGADGAAALRGAGAERPLRLPLRDLQQETGQGPQAIPALSRRAASVT
ncbi:transmembrane 4 L6 family member 1-like isoform X2 [Gopherus evgoodei]|uniref:transmembrane 4 L6 family member 1-like isoform X2 n=1 Tax=Gopherus evgoodei TaxID=1825980 RepID=UPI0011D0316B|nr:transmembrane 4 L6 family member 1-like isoform X2 [Gopherus evgoodei]